MFARVPAGFSPTWAARPGKRPVGCQTAGPASQGAMEVPYIQAVLGNQASRGTRPQSPPSSGATAGTSHHGIGCATGLSQGNGAAGSTLRYAQPCASVCSPDVLEDSLRCSSWSTTRCSCTQGYTPTSVVRRPRLRPSRPTSGQSTAKAGPWRPLRAGASVATAAPLTHVSQALASAAAAEGRGHQVVHLDYLVDQALRRKGV